MPPAAAAVPVPVMTCLTKFCVLLQNPALQAGPVTRKTAQPRANFLTDGDACAALKASASTGTAGAAFAAMSPVAFAVPSPHAAVLLTFPRGGGLG